jgi:hypothetical protein
VFYVISITAHHSKALGLPVSYDLSGRRPADGASVAQVSSEILLVVGGQVTSSVVRAY